MNINLGDLVLITMTTLDFLRRLHVNDTILFLISVWTLFLILFLFKSGKTLLSVVRTHSREFCNVLFKHSIEIKSLFSQNNDFELRPNKTNVPVYCIIIYSFIKHSFTLSNCKIVQIYLSNWIIEYFKY